MYFPPCSFEVSNFIMTIIIVNITQLAFLNRSGKNVISANGNNLACSSGSKYIHVTSFSNMKESDPVLVGHDAAINSLHFSLSSKWLVRKNDAPSTSTQSLTSLLSSTIALNVSSFSFPLLAGEQLRRHDSQDVERQVQKVRPGH